MCSVCGRLIGMRLLGVLDVAEQTFSNRATVVPWGTRVGLPRLSPLV